MTCRDVSADELLRSGYAQRVVATSSLDDEISTLLEQLLAVAPGPLAMTRAMTAAVGRTHPAMSASWADADHQQWAFTEAEYLQVAANYMQKFGSAGRKSTEQD